MKRCCTCYVTKPLTDFYRYSLSKDGRQPRCIKCSSKHDRARGANTHNRGNRRLRGRQCKVHPECATIDRAEVLRRGQGICGICKRPITRKKWHMDHIIPVSKKGIHCYDNLQPSHVRCNLRKGNKT